MSGPRSPARVVPGNRVMPLSLAEARAIVDRAGYASEPDFDTGTVLLVDSDDRMTAGEFIWYAVGLSRYAPRA